MTMSRRTITPHRSSLHWPVLSTPFHTSDIWPEGIVRASVGGKCVFVVAAGVRGGHAAWRPRPSARRATRAGGCAGQVHPAHWGAEVVPPYSPPHRLPPLLSISKSSPAVSLAPQTTRSLERSDPVIYSIPGRTRLGNTNEINPRFSENSQCNW